MGLLPITWFSFGCWRMNGSQRACMSQTAGCGLVAALLKPNRFSMGHKLTRSLAITAGARATLMRLARMLQRGGFLWQPSS